MSVMAATIIAFLVTAAAASTSVSAFTSSFAPSSSSSSQNNKNGRVQDAKQCRRPLLLPFPKQSTLLSVRMQARQRRYPEEEDEDDGMYYDDEFDDEYDDYYDDEPEPPRRRRRLDDLGTAGSGAEMQVPSPFGLRSGLRLPDSVSKAVLAGIFVLGIGTGVTIDSQINTNPKDLASRDAIDQNAPNPIVCARYGASAMAFDQRVFVSFNPFNVYVAQADVKPACVLRQSNGKQNLYFLHPYIIFCRTVLSHHAGLKSVSNTPYNVMNRHKLLFCKQLSTFNSL